MDSMRGGEGKEGEKDCEGVKVGKCGSANTVYCTEAGIGREKRKRC